MANIRFARNRLNGAVGFTITGAFPFAIVYPLANKEYAILKVKPRLLQGYLNDQHRISLSNRNITPTEYQAEYLKQRNLAFAVANMLAPSKIFDDPKRAAEVSTLDDAIKNLPKIFTLIPSASKHDVHEYLVTENGVHPANFNALYGELDHAAEDSKSVVVGSCRFFFPANMRESRRTEYINIVNTCRDIYAKHGLGKVISGDITFSPIKKRGDVGYYRLSTRDVQIDPSGKESNLRVLYTLIHEFAHKLMFEFLSPTKVGEISKKYNDLYREHNHASDDAGDVLASGTKLIYTGKKKAFAGEWSVSTPGARMIIKSANSGARLSAPLSALLASGFTIVGRENHTPKILDVSLDLSNFDRDSTEHWFPTRYSKTNASEWFAELVSMHVNGKLQGEVKSYVEYLIK